MWLLGRCVRNEGTVDHLIFASYGNDSIALIQWAHERGLPGVHVAYGDTGWAADWWAGRVDQAGLLHLSEVFAEPEPEDPAA